MKSSGPVNVRPGKNERSRWSWQRSISPLASGSAGRHTTAFTPSVSLKDGLTELVEWFRGGPMSPREMLLQIEEQNWRGADSRDGDSSVEHKNLVGAE